jgi:prophage regulatory protein
MHVSGSQQTGLAQTSSKTSIGLVTELYGLDFSANPARRGSHLDPKVAACLHRENAVQQPSSPPPDFHDQVPTVFLRMPSVMQMTGLGRSTIYRLMAQQQFPCPVRLGVRAVAWRRSELDLWSQTRPATSH